MESKEDETFYIGVSAEFEKEESLIFRKDFCYFSNTDESYYYSVEEDLIENKLKVLLEKIEDPDEKIELEFEIINCDLTCFISQLDYYEKVKFEKVLKLVSECKFLGLNKMYFFDKLDEGVDGEFCMNTTIPTRKILQKYELNELDVECFFKDKFYAAYLKGCELLEKEGIEFVRFEEKDVRDMFKEIPYEVEDWECCCEKKFSKTKYEFYPEFKLYLHSSPKFILSVNGKKYWFDRFI